jgi:hypothetical protein
VETGDAQKLWGERLLPTYLAGLQEQLQGMMSWEQRQVTQAGLTMRMPCLSKSILESEDPNFCSSSTALNCVCVTRVARILYTK